jgi:hypothetical protein
VNIDPKERLSGIPMLEVRAFLRKAQDRLLLPRHVEDAFGRVPGQRLLQALLERGELCPVEVCGEVRYELTLAGGALARARAGRPFDRKTAEEALAGFIERCELVRRRPLYLYKVRRALLFGSMLTDKPQVGDVDLAVHLVPKDPEHIVDASRDQARRAKRQGRRLSSFFEELAYSEQRVMVYLKHRSRVLQLHDHTDGVLGVCKSRIVFEDLEGYPVRGEVPEPTDDAEPPAGAKRPKRRQRKDDIPF